MADNNVKNNLDDAAENLGEATKSAGRAAKSTAKAAEEATKVAADKTADVAEDVAEEAAKVFKKPTILNDLNTIATTSVRAGVVVTFGAFGFLGGVVAASRLIDVVDRVVAKRKA